MVASTQKQMTWLILGGRGQLGTALQRLLTTYKTNFIVPKRSELDITKLEDVKSIDSLSPTVIINCAAWTDVDGAELHPGQARTINCDASRNIAEVAKSLGIPYVFLSTDYVFSGVRSTPWRESDPRNPVSVYGLSKAEAEQAVLTTYSEGSYIVRTAWLYSPWRTNFAKTILSRALLKLETRVVIDQVGQPTSALDLAQQIVKLIAQRAPFGVYHGTNSGKASWFDFAYEIFQLAGVSTDLLLDVKSDDYPMRAQRPHYSVLGHDNWQKTKIGEMRDWKIALNSVFPEILEVVARELPSV